MIEFFKRAAASVISAGTGKAVLFIDSADSLPKTKDEAGTVTVLGNGITSITLLGTTGLNKDYRITLQSGAVFDYSVADGRSIVSVVLQSTVGLVKTYRITFNDATTFDYTVTDGAPGADGAAVATRNEGTLLTSNTSQYNFVGAGVDATNSGSQVTVTINGANGFGVVTGNTGTANSDSPGDSLAITGSNGITTTATDTPDGLVISPSFGAPSTILPDAGADNGVENLFARSDHVHAISAGTPVSLGGTNTEGVSTSFARADHIHTHGDLAGGSLHSLSTISTPGFQSAADKARQDNDARGLVNVLDFGADSTGATSSATAFTNAINALPNGGIVFVPAGIYNLGNTPFVISKAHITLRGAARYNTTITSTSTTQDIIQTAEFYINIEDLAVVGPATSDNVENSAATAGSAINADSGAYTIVRRCFIRTVFNGIRLGNTLASVDDVEIRHFKGSGIVVDHNSDHQINLVIMDNNTSFLPSGGGIQVLRAASLLLSNSNIIHANFCLDIAPATGVTIPSVKGVNCFFDTSAVGLNMTTAGSFFRSEFTNCWFSSMSIAGIRLAPTSANGVDGITFVNCDIYNNVGGTTNGILIGSANVSKWKLVGSSIAGWTNGINLQGGTNHFPTISSNTIGAIAAFGVNGTGILVNAGTYKGLVINGNDVADNTAALNLGAVTIAVPSYERIVDNAGINPRGTELRPVATPALATLYTNSTGFRVQVHVKHGATANTGVIVNGVTVTATYVAAQIAVYNLEPGGSIQFTGGTAPTVWSWIGQ